ncbi:MAG: ATP-binding protein [Rhizobiales bacterium 65-79]|jgi:hypothetical protein|nr:ATP-binding protein [Hyphomicrobiales bacterium]OJU02940.1 MAG: ATP-binding protein [Rhizobiales bacterium 65-79]
MPKSFGRTDFRNGPGAFATRLRLADGPLGLAWHHCAATADFLGDFFALHRKTSQQTYTETRHSIGYLVNELLENAVKFREPGDIIIESALEGDRFEVRIRNSISLETARRFQALLAELTARDPGELLIARIEANAADPGADGSGLGLLTLMNDYGARLGWIFHDGGAEANRRIDLDTFAALDLF